MSCDCFLSQYDHLSLQSQDPISYIRKQINANILTEHNQSICLVFGGSGLFYGDVILMPECGAAALSLT
jgi:hypothetical protein